mgnify:CR=1 FL=1
MSRVKRGTVVKSRHKRLLKKTKGFWGQRKNIFKRANETLLRGMAFAYRGRKMKKRDMRGLFITRISAAVQSHGLSYSVFIHKLANAQVMLNRKMLSQIAILDPRSFTQLVALVNK